MTLKRLHCAYRASVHSTVPSFPMATSERVAVPPVVVAGTTTSAYVPPLNGCNSPTRPLSVRVHAVAPLAVEIAVIVEVAVPSVAVDSLTVNRLPSDSVK